MSDYWHVRSGSVMAGGWAFTCDNGVRLPADTLDDLRIKVAEFYLQNKWPVVNLQDKITEQICTGKSGPNLCQKVAGVKVDDQVTHHDVFVSNTAQDYINSAHKIAEAGIVELVNQSTAEARAQICSECPMNRAIALCPKCVSSANHMFGLIRKGHHLQSEHGLHMCQSFRTDIKTFCWLKMPEVLPSFEHVPANCWRHNT